ncbi:MAG: TIM barrel protein [Clostridia bacterium]|nr:TIM barrel protein [Clostridia bacterium]
MLIPGLVTVTFRKFGIPKICTTASAAGLSLLEWGGDVHVPPMDEGAVSRAKSCSAACGLTIDTYGSYYRCNGTDEDIDAVVTTAHSLGANNLSVWAVTRGTADTDAAMRREITDNLRRVCVSAAKFGITVSPEFHGGTITDHFESAVRLAHDVAEDNLRLYWQPNQFRDLSYNLSALEAVQPFLSNVHVFAWAGHDKFPLEAAESPWRQYIERIAADGRDHGMLLEFVCDDTEEQLYRDAETLRRWLG